MQKQNITETNKNKNGYISVCSERSGHINFIRLSARSVSSHAAFHNITMDNYISVVLIKKIRVSRLLLYLGGSLVI